MKGEMGNIVYRCAEKYPFMDWDDNKFMMHVIVLFITEDRGEG